MERKGRAPYQPYMEEAPGDCENGYSQNKNNKCLDFKNYRLACTFVNVNFTQEPEMTPLM